VAVFNLLSFGLLVSYFGRVNDPIRQISPDTKEHICHCNLLETRISIGTNLLQYTVKIKRELKGFYRNVSQ